jgi:Leucine-rich repeat (LRR) protein
LREIPRSVYKLPLLETLDISRNKVRNISREVKNLTSLRVFAILHNRVEDLPFELSEMTQLQILKVQENPLRFELKKVIEAKEAQLGPLNLTENEKEIAITAKIKSFLREGTLSAALPISRPKRQSSEFSPGTISTPFSTDLPYTRLVPAFFPTAGDGARGASASFFADDSLQRCPRF